MKDSEQKLTPEEYAVLREGATEPAFSGAYVHNKKDGMYRCRYCNHDLFSSDTKFDSGSGWPSFTKPVERENVTLAEDTSHGMHRTEVRCAHCDSHLGHVFPDGPQERGGERYCINSAALSFDEDS